MLREIQKVNRRHGEPRKRWFSSDTMDIFIWVDDNNSLLSYQLTYGKPLDEKAVLWSAN